MLPIILLMALLYQGRAVQYGTDFVTAFPENVAYYYPAELSLNLKITALEGGTSINIIYNGTINQTTLESGQTKVMVIANVEESQMGVSPKVIRITSTKNITVLSITKRGDSIQTNVVLPVAALNTSYQIPLPDYSELALLLNSYQYSNTSTSEIAFNFRLIVINADNQTNTVTVSGQDSGSPYTLNPNTMVQLQGLSPGMTITGTLRLAVILTHPCVDTVNCRCNMIMHQIRPSSLQGKDFIVPPFVNTTITRLFVTSKDTVDVKLGSETKTTVDPGSTSMLPFYPSASASMVTLTVPGSLRVIRPGLMLDLLPNSMFAGCFLVHSTSWLKTLVLIIADTTVIDQVNMDRTAFTNLDWKPMNDLGYSWALASIVAYKSHVIWHPTSKIAVYVFDRSASGLMYGSAAIVLNDQPDYYGCAVTGSRFEVVNDTMDWVTSRVHCISKGMTLMSPSINITQVKMKAELLKTGLQSEVWIGLRRSLASSSWYWQNRAVFDFSNWAEGHPDKMVNGMCASMMQNFTWTSTRCCSAIKPLCYLSPVYIYTLIPISFEYTASQAWPAMSTSSGTSTVNPPTIDG